ncbi:MAG: hypothetical protein OHK0046_43230 [Anaerolineae bacterium]
MLCVVVAGVLLTYVATSVMIGQGNMVMPLDDAYIHFQYARQAASGQPYVYNPGDPPTSGATSFLYPYLLAAGYAIGFQGLSLGLWALGIGALLLLASGWLVYWLVRALLIRWQMLPFSYLNGLPLLAALTFVLNGAVSWHFMSGMETGLMITGVLCTLYMFLRADLRGFIPAASLLALTRPEGSIMAIIAVGLFVVRLAAHQIIPPYDKWAQRAAPLLIPMFAVGVQPAVNLLLTGSMSSTGGQAKSIFGMVPFYWDVVIGRIWENFTRMWAGFAADATYLPLPLVILAFFGGITLLFSRRERWTAMLVILWLLTITAAIATLDTAFWHFKRYQMPLMTLFYPLAAYGVIGALRLVLWLRATQPTYEQRNSPLGNPSLRIAGVILVTLFLLLPTAANWVEFLRLYRVNVENVMAQPLPMARWLAENTPEDAVIAVHDVGMMRYLGERHTLDMVGLTTPGAADAWRNGPGAVAEFLTAHNPPPDYIAAYTTARGLNYLAETDIYGNLLMGFTATYNPADNVALGAEFQGIYRYQAEAPPEHLPQTVDALDVANLSAEEAHHYHWSDQARLTGFISEVYAFETFNPWQMSSASGEILDGGRRINGEESFTMQARPNEDAVLVTRLHPVNAGTFDVYANGQLVDTQWIPAVPGQWFEVATLIPAQTITDAQLSLRIVPNVPGGHYMPYYHWLLQGDYNPPVEVLAEDSVFDTPAIPFEGFNLFVEISPDADVTAAVQTTGTATGDYKFFIHLYADVNAPPVAQADAYLLSPPGNWLPGVVGETLMVEWAALPAGVYQVAVGFYNPYTFERPLPEGVEVPYQLDAANRRIFIGEIEKP